MKFLLHTSFMVLAATGCLSAHAQTPPASEIPLGQVPIKGKPAVPLAQTLLPVRPALCDGAPCDLKLKPKLKPTDICIAAICMPIEPKVIPKILGPDTLHWRIRANGSMAQFLGETQLSDFAKNNMQIPLDASASEIRELPIVGLKNSLGNGAVQYWVRVK